MNDELIYEYERAKMRHYSREEFVYQYVYDELGFVGEEAKAVVDMYLKRLKNYEKSKMIGINKTAYTKLQQKELTQ